MSLSRAVGAFALLSAAACQTDPNGVTPVLLSNTPKPQMTKAEAEVKRNHFSEIITNPAISGRFPGAIVLGEREFASTIVNQQFRYLLSNEIAAELPAESFSTDRRYSVGHRAIAQGHYSFEKGIVTIECRDCPETFLGLGRKRVFFRHRGKLMMANANGKGRAIELIK